MLTPTYAPTATERVLPGLALDFTTGVLDPRVAVARALNTATRVNSSGFIETVNADLPRFDYDRATLAPKGLLIEETRQNLALQSPDMSQAVWVKAGVGAALTPVVTPNAGMSPDGANNAVRVQFDCTDASSSTNRSRITQTITVANGTTYSRGLWVKAYDANSVGKTVRFTTDNIGVNLVYTLTDQWVRINPTSATAASTSTVFTIETRGTVTTQTADVLLWNATLEVGAFLTSDIITGATSLTRNADVVSMTGTNFSDWYNASEGAFLTRFSFPAIPASQFRYVLAANDGTDTNFIAIAGNTTSNVPAGRVVTSSVTQASMGGGAITANQQAIGVLAYKLDSFAYSQNGATTGTDASGTVPTINRLDIGALTTSYANCHIQKISYWPQRITNSETLAFSK